MLYGIPIGSDTVLVPDMFGKFSRETGRHLQRVQAPAGMKGGPVAYVLRPTDLVRFHHWCATKIQSVWRMYWVCHWRAKELQEYGIESHSSDRSKCTGTTGDLYPLCSAVLHS